MALLSHNVLIARQVYGDVASRVQFDKGRQERLDLYNLMYRGMFYFNARSGSCLIQRLSNAHLIIPPSKPLQLGMRPLLRDPPVREHKDDVRILDRR